MGNNPEATGATEFKPAAPRLVNNLCARPNTADRERIYNREGLRSVRENPGRALHRCLVKMGSLWSFYFRTQTRTPYSNPLAGWAQGLGAGTRSSAPPPGWPGSGPSGCPSCCSPRSASSSSIRRSSP